MQTDFDSDLGRALSAARQVLLVVNQVQRADALTPGEVIRAVRAFEAAALDEGGIEVLPLCRSLLTDLESVRRARVSPASFGAGAVERIDSYAQDLLDRQSTSQKERMAA